VFVKKSYLSSWVFTAIQSVQIRINSFLSPPKKIPGSAYVASSTDSMVLINEQFEFFNLLVLAVFSN